MLFEQLNPGRYERRNVSNWWYDDCSTGHTNHIVLLLIVQLHVDPGRLIISQSRRIPLTARSPQDVLFMCLMKRRLEAYFLLLTATPPPPPQMRP